MDFLFRRLVLRDDNDIGGAEGAVDVVEDEEDGGRGGRPAVEDVRVRNPALGILVCEITTILSPTKKTIFIATVGAQIQNFKYQSRSA